jgi:hypothetical protein
VKITARDLYDKVQNALAHLLDGDFAGNDGAGVDIDDVWHAPGQVRVCR